MFRDTNVQSRNPPLNIPAEGRQPRSGVIATRPKYDDFRYGQRRGPDDVIVLD